MSFRVMPKGQKIDLAEYLVYTLFVTHSTILDR